MFNTEKILQYLYCHLLEASVITAMLQSFMPSSKYCKTTAVYSVFSELAEILLYKQRGRERGEGGSEGGMRGREGR